MTWDDVINYVNSYLSEEDAASLKEYVFEVGEYEEAFDLIVAYIIQKKIPISKELYEWIQWYGSESERLGNEIDTSWKQIKL